MYNILQCREILQDFFDNFKSLLIGELNNNNINTINSIIRFTQNKNIFLSFDKKYPKFFTKILEMFYISKFSIDDILNMIRCKHCGQKTKYYKLSYHDYCCRDCASKSDIRKEKFKESFKNVDYAVRHIKSEQTKLLRYNDSNYNNRTKFKETCLEKYGTERPSESEIIKDRIKETNKIRYGVENVFQSEQIKQKIKDTNIERYGVENVYQSEIIKDKIKQTNLERYGYEHAMHSEEIKERHRQTCLEKYGVENNFQSESSKTKMRVTCLEKYGVEYYAQTNECQKRKCETNQIRYGSNTFTEAHLTNVDDMNYDFIKENFIKDGFISLDKLMEYFNCSASFYYQMLRDRFGFDEGVKPSQHRTQLKIYEWILSLNINAKNDDRKILSGKELDILLPNNNLAIEYDGLMFHSFGKSNHSMFNNHLIENSNKHVIKTDECKKQGIQLLHIFENEWLNKENIWKSVIKSKLGLNERIFARKCAIRKIDNVIKTEFLNNNHLQGNCSSSINIGLYYDNELVSVMTFGKSRYNKNYEYELIRFCNKLNLNVIGGASKLLSYFIKNYTPKSLISYANRRWSDGNMYNKLGFNLINTSEPNYFYFLPTEYILHSRLKFQKHKLSQIFHNYDETLTETENMYNNDYRKIYDCGNYVFIKIFY